MQNAGSLSQGQIEEFLESSEEIEFVGQGCEEVYAWVQKVLVSQEFGRMKKKEKELAKTRNNQAGQASIFHFPGCSPTPTPIVISISGSPPSVPPKGAQSLLKSPFFLSVFIRVHLWPFCSKCSACFCRFSQ